MSELKPGLYRANVRDVPNQIIMVHDATNPGHACTVGKVGRWTMHSPGDYSDARPLIVLDLGTHNAADLADVLREDGYGDLAIQIEAQVKPARIPEPGLWGVVEATYSGWHRGSWVHCDGDVWRSLRDDGHEWVTWTSLVDPVLVREGIN